MADLITFEGRVTKEKVAHLLQVFNEILVIPEEKLVRNRKQRQYSLIEKFLGNRGLDPEFLARPLFCRWKMRGSYGIIHMGK